MSNMKFEVTDLFGDTEILKRIPFEGIPMTLDFSSVTTTVNGKKVVKAGTPIGATGVADNTSSVVGILLSDVLEERPQGTLLKKAYINTSKAELHSGFTYDDDMKAALPMIVFE